MSKIKKISTRKPPRAKDITGEKFGMWTVEGFSHIILNEEGRAANYMYNCRCECGVERKVAISNLKTKTHKGPRGCGCAVRRSNDLSGQTFGHWQILELDHIKRSPNYNTGKQTTITFYRCLCGLCENEKIVSAANLKSGKTKSCGCQRKKKSADNIKHTSSKPS